MVALWRRDGSQWCGVVERAVAVEAVEAVVTRKLVWLKVKEA